MKKSSRRKWARTGLIAMLVVTLCVAGSGVAFGKKRQKTTTTTDAAATVEVNPTNTAVVDKDLDGLALSIAVPEEELAVDQVEPYADGESVVVAILDAGFVTSHPAIARSISPYAYDAVDGDYDPNDRGDGLDNDRDGLVDEAAGHGTFVAGMVLSVAPNATILPIRVADAEGHGSGESLALGLKYAMKAGADVINLSLEVNHADIDFVAEYLSIAMDYGIVVVASAGNDGETGLGLLAASNDTVTVGAVDCSNTVAFFSNASDASQRVSIFAPGVNLFGPIGTPETDSSGVWSGTSFSTGLVSGAAALLRECDPWLTSQGFRSLLQRTWDPVYDANGKKLRRAGVLNLPGLMEAVR